jgi:hypothetical protein
VPFGFDDRSGCPADTGPNFVLHPSSEERIVIELATNMWHTYDDRGRTEPIHRRHSLHHKAPMSAD